MALPTPVSQQHNPHARHLSRLSIAPLGMGGPLADHPIFTPMGAPQFAHFQSNGQPGGPAPPPQSAFQFGANPMQQAQSQRQLGHGHQPSLAMHRSRPSLANIPGFMPGVPVPMTAGPHMTSFNQFPLPPTPGGSQQQFAGTTPHFRSRRQQSISIGGPPKATLGGPQARKAVTPTPVVAAAPEGKQKKVVVKLPKETLDEGEAGDAEADANVASSSRRRPKWARNPIPLDAVPPQPDSQPPELSSTDIYQVYEDGDTTGTAPTVGLPRRNAWEIYRTNIMEEKLARLGVEPSGYPGMGIGVPPHIMLHHHNRASSVSTPADPALLARHGSRQTPSPLGVPHPLSALTPNGSASSFPSPQQNRALAPAFSPSGGQSQPPPVVGSMPSRFQPPSGPAGARGFHSHSMSLAAPAYHPPNPYLSPSVGIGSTNPFGSGAVLGGDSTSSQGPPSLSVSPQPGTLPSVSEYEEEDDGGEDSAANESGPKIHAPKPRGMLHLRPVFVSNQSSPAPSSSAELRTDGDRITPPVTAVAPAKSLSTVDFMRGFGIDDDDEEPAEDEGLEVPIVDEQQRDRLIAEEKAAGPTPTSARFPTDVVTEDAMIEQAVNSVDPAEDADDEEVQSELEAGGETEPEDNGVPENDNFTTPSHSRHVSKVSMAPSLAEMGSHGGTTTAKGFRDFRFGGARLSEGDEPHDGEQVEVEVDGERQIVYLNDDVATPNPQWAPAGDYQQAEAVLHGLSDTDDVGEWSNPSDEERARQEKRERRAALVKQVQARHLARTSLQERTLHSESSFISNPSEDPRQSEDINSNPSDDEYGEVRGTTFGPGVLSSVQAAVPNAGADFSPVVQRPLPPLPHSRQTSHQFPQAASPASHHHSPAPSGHTATPLIKGHVRMPSKTDLNPLAKPFVFGARPGSNWFNLQSPATEVSAPLPTSAPSHTSSHSRQLSATTKLNIAAPVFKPTGFPFTPIQGVPTMSFAAPMTESESRPLPMPPTSDPTFPVQGREKRQKLSVDESVTEQVDFQFPKPTAPSQNVNDLVIEEPTEEKPRPIVERRGTILNVNAKPFSFGASLAASKSESDLLKTNSLVPPSKTKSEQLTPVRTPSPEAEPSQQAISMPGSALNSPKVESNIQLAQSTTAAFGRVSSVRKPIPEFGSPASTATVPAGLFKALARPEGGSPVRRSTIGGRDIFEHTSRRSLDDLNVPLISKKMASKTPATLPAEVPVTIITPKPDVPPLALAPPPRPKERRSSAPSQTLIIREPSPSAVSDSLLSSVLQKRAVDFEQLEGRIDEMMDDKMARLRDEISEMTTAKSRESDGAVNAAIGQLVSSFRLQMMDYMKKVAETNMSRTDAHGELDFELVRGVIEEGHQKIRHSVLQEVASIVDKLPSPAPERPHPPMEVLHAIEDLRSVVADMVDSSTRTIVAHSEEQEDYMKQRALEERQLLLRDLANVLLPRISALRPEPLDIDAITEQLSEAVKPHISQLIDLASDKKETAVLITQHLSPLLHSMVPRIDFTGVASQVAMEVARLAPPTDPHVLKEEVADLVIERLDARLANRDATLNPEAIATRVARIIGPLSDLSNLPTAEAFDDLHKRHDALHEQSTELLAKQNDAVSKLGEVPVTLMSAHDSLKAAEKLLGEKAALLGELEELKKLATTNADLQSQLGKARSSHGQVRSEKDLLAQRLQAVEQERDKLRSELETAKRVAEDHASEAKNAEEKTSAVESSLEQALERLKSSDKAEKDEKKRSDEFDRQNRDLHDQLRQMQSKVKTMELEASFAARDLRSAVDAKERLEKEVDTLRDQQQYWDDLRRTADQVETLSRLIGAADSEEVLELKRIRDQHKVVEKEHSALQKRCADQEAKIATLQRTTASNKQTIAQTQQKSSEWEKRARSAEGELESTQTELEQARDIQAQLETDVANFRDELETHTAALKVAGDREQQLQQKVVTLESQLLSVKAELEEVQAAQVRAPPAKVPSTDSWQRVTAVPNGRPGSRSSTLNGASRPGTSTPNGRGSPATPPAQGLWDSIHAPKSSYQTSVNRPSYTRTSSINRRNVASPAPSVVSVAATEQDDGWWS